jgi:hypothetical protein
METILKTADQMKQLNKVDLKDKKRFGSSSFCHYTKVNSLDSILQSEAIWVSKLTQMNDLNEKKRYEKMGLDSFFGLCFCNSDSEKIPMWYLYAGISGNGARIRLTPAKLKWFLDSIKVVYPVYSGTAQPKELQINRDCVMKIGWVFYTKKDRSNTVKYKNKWYNVQRECVGEASVNQEILSEEYKNFEKNNYFIKDYPWEYEKEFRIIFDFSKYKEKHGCVDFDKISVPINIKDFKLMLAPEIKNLENVFTMPGFKKFIRNSIEQSGLSISMGLLGKDVDGIITSLEDALEHSDQKERFLQKLNLLLEKNMH